LVSKKTRPIGLTLLVVPVVLVLLAAGMLFTFDSPRLVPYPGTATVTVTADLNSAETGPSAETVVDATDGTTDISTNVRPGGVLWAVGHAIIRAADNAKQRKQNGEKESEAPTVAGAEPAVTDEGRPEWVDAEPHRDGHAFLVPIKVGPFSSLSECEQGLPRAMQEAVDEYATKLLGAEARRSVRLPLDFLQEHVVQGQWEERTFSPALERDMYNLHVLMSFDREANARLLETARQAVVAERLTETAGMLAIVLLLLSIIYGYLKVDLATGGAYRWRLRLVAGAMLLVLATGVLLLVA
jgi:hypothetical protein